MSAAQRERHRQTSGAPQRRASRPPLHIDVAVPARRPARGPTPSRRQIEKWAGAALGLRGLGKEISVRVVGPAESRKLNAQYRGKDRPTNVLSFPVDPHGFGDGRRRSADGNEPRIEPLGDLVICPDVLRTEAREQGKTLRAHWAHLVVHGALHLVGYDHEQPRDARRMERREIDVLARLGFGNPYRST